MHTHSDYVSDTSRRTCLQDTHDWPRWKVSSVQLRDVGVLHLPRIRQLFWLWYKYREQIVSSDLGSVNFVCHVRGVRGKYDDQSQHHNLKRDEFVASRNAVSGWDYYVRRFCYVTRKLMKYNDDKMLLRAVFRTRLCIDISKAFSHTASRKQVYEIQYCRQHLWFCLGVLLME